MTPTRRVALGGALAAAVWRLGGQAQADGAPAEAAKGFLGFEAAPAKLQLAPPPAEPAAACAYAGAIPGPLIRLRRGEELSLKFPNKLPDATTLSFPGLRAGRLDHIDPDRARGDRLAAVENLPLEPAFRNPLRRLLSLDGIVDDDHVFAPRLANPLP